jgi:hypothetical protein
MINEDTHSFINHPFRLFEGWCSCETTKERRCHDLWELKRYYAAIHSQQDLVKNYPRPCVNRYWPKTALWTCWLSKKQLLLRAPVRHTVHSSTSKWSSIVSIESLFGASEYITAITKTLYDVYLCQIMHRWKLSETLDILTGVRKGFIIHEYKTKITCCRRGLNNLVR